MTFIKLGGLYTCSHRQIGLGYCAFALLGGVVGTTLSGIMGMPLAVGPALPGIFPGSIAGQLSAFATKREVTPRRQPVKRSTKLTRTVDAILSTFEGLRTQEDFKSLFGDSAPYTINTGSLYIPLVDEAGKQNLFDVLSHTAMLVLAAVTLTHYEPGASGPLTGVDLGTLSRTSFKLRSGAFKLGESGTFL